MTWNVDPTNAARALMLASSFPAQMVIAKEDVEGIKFFQKFKPSSKPRVFDPTIVAAAAAKRKKEAGKDSAASGKRADAAKAAAVANPMAKYIIAVVSGKEKRYQP